MVIPKRIRDQLGLAPGTVVEVVEREGCVEIAAADAPIHLRAVGGVLVACSTDEMPPLTDDIVRETLERTRR